MNTQKYNITTDGELIVKNDTINETPRFRGNKDDLIDYNGTLLAAGKKTGKDKKKGKATLISLLGDKNTIKYANKLILKINTKLKKYGPKSKNLTETLNYILNRNK